MKAQVKMQQRQNESERTGSCKNTQALVQLKKTLEYPFQKSNGHSKFNLGVSDTLQTITVKLTYDN